MSHLFRGGNMRGFRTSAAVLLLAAGPLFAEDAKNCLDLIARTDNDVSSPSGVRVTINGRNHCSVDLDGREARFKVMAVGAGGAVIATQNGRFGGTIAPGAQVETKVFVSCDPERIKSLRVEPR
jgi:hypothetical protein